jgi:hypothetical protein
MNRVWLSIIRLARVATDRFSWWLVVSCAFFVVVLGTLGFCESNTDPEQPVLTSIYRAIQLFLMESGNVEGRVNIKLEIARWLGVAVLFGTLLKGLLIDFEDRVEALIIRSLSDHIIVCGAGERGLNLAYDLTDHADFVVLIDMHDHWETDNQQHAHRGLFYLKGNAGEQATLNAAAASRARSMFVIDSDDDVEILARIEHRRWMAERFLDGWQYGATRNDQQKLHPDLVPWEELDESTREYDRKPVMQIPSLLESVGLHVVSCE